ncbi:MAG: glycosyltransferase, partial [Planctomycetota bacterium]
ERERERRKAAETMLAAESASRRAAEEETRRSGAELARERELLQAARREVARGWGEVDAMRATKVWKLMIAWEHLHESRRRLGRALARGIAATGRFLHRSARALPRPLGWAWLLAGLAGAELAGRRRRAGRRTPAPTSPPGAPALAWRPRILVVSPYQVHPPDHGGGVRILNLVRRLAADCELHLLIFHHGGDDPVQRAALAPYCASVGFHDWQPRLQPDLLGLGAPNAQLFASEALEARIRELVHTLGIDVVQLEYTELGQFARASDGVPVILTEHDIARRQHRRRRRLAFHRRFPEGNDFGRTYLDWVRTARYEIAVCRRADRVLAMSADDAGFLARYLSDGRARLRVAPNAVDTRSYVPGGGLDSRRGVLFVGNWQNLPNVDALEFFLADVWPLVRLRRPDATLSVVGANPSPRVLGAGGRDGVTVVGPVADLRRTYLEHRVLVAPLRAGSGTRLKILEAFASGLPVVSTRLGAEGIECADGEHLLLADDPVPMARALERLLADDELAGALAARARRLVEERYDWGRTARVYLATYAELAAPRGPRRRAAVPAADPVPEAPGAEPRPAISVVIPTKNGGPLLLRALERVFAQQLDRPFEVVCVDSGSSPAELAAMRHFPLRLDSIAPEEFDHGLTRDRGAALARGEVFVFLNQDAVPAANDWLARLTAPLFAGDARVAAVQGGIREVPEVDRRFFWDSCGERFYFTRESRRWIAAHGGIGFSTVNAAIGRDAWRAHPFGWAPILEDKKWQGRIAAAGLAIVERPDAFVHHTHDYDLRSLVRRCTSEGAGWRALGERYSLGSLLADLAIPRVYLTLAGGLLRGRVRTLAELLFPLVRPLALFYGSRRGWARPH